MTIKLFRITGKQVQTVNVYLEEHLCLSQFQLGTSPGNPWENFFERANPGHLGTFSVCLIPCPGQKKMMIKFPGVGQNFPKPKKLLLKGAMSLKRKHKKSAGDLLTNRYLCETYNKFS